MKYYPVCLDVRNKDCLVVGGGQVASRKVKTLIGCGANVEVIAPYFSGELTKMEENHGDRLRLIHRVYEAGDVAGRFLVIGATDDEAENRRISADAEKNNILCNIADVPDACSFILPSIIKRGDLLLAISTSGNSPAFAKHLRKTLEKEFGEEYTDFLRLMGGIRKKLLAARHAPEEHKPLFEALIEGGLLELVKNNQTTEINRLLREVMGDELGDYCDCHTLMETANDR